MLNTEPQHKAALSPSVCLPVCPSNLLCISQWIRNKGKPRTRLKGNQHFCTDCSCAGKNSFHFVFKAGRLYSTLLR